MGSIDRRIQDLEERLSAGERERVSIRPEVAAVLDRIAAIKHHGAEASDEERAELAEFERALKAELKKRRAEGRI